jgi:hypothetical protein
MSIRKKKFNIYEINILKKLAPTGKTLRSAVESIRFIFKSGRKRRIFPLSPR